MAKKFSINVALTNTLTTNILNGAITSLSGPVGFTATQPKIKITRIRSVNKTNAAHTVSLFRGATGANAAGTEYLWSASTVPANDSLVEYPNTAFESTDFLVGGADANTSIVLNIDFEYSFD